VGGGRRGAPALAGDRHCWRWCGGGAATLVVAGARPVAVVVGPGTPVRAAPHGAAAASTTLEAGAAVLAGRRYGRWVEVRRSDGVRGWLLDAELVRP
jgi:hypothetical protein